MAAARAWRLILVPALVTLVVSVVRLVGELRGWSPRWFSAEAGGRGALLGIVWLVPLFGAWFGWQCARAGDGPARRGRALLLHVVAAAVYVGGFQVVIRVLAFDTSTPAGLERQMLAMGGVSVLAALVALLAWPRLFATNLLYGLLARLPVAVITWLAATNAWSTHHVKFGPSDFAGWSPTATAAWLSYAQLVFWVGFTVVAGGLCGTLAALPVRRQTNVETAGGPSMTAS